MNKNLITAVIIATIFGAGPVVAQQSGTMGQSGQSSQVQSEQTQAYVGWPVFSSDGEQIGTVKSAEGQALKVEMDQALGIGAKTVAVEKDQYNAGEDRINLTISQDEAKKLPEAQTN
ncbi:MAG: PRC-barrel domain-containing protein [Alphaproteobacteria bacterium]|nr:PRC-barrel domain-containing protein [Alphaproteobacteria bacterium]